MSSHVLAVDLVALLLALTGFHLAFRQKLVRLWWERLRVLRGRSPRAPTAHGDEDPVHYALIIFGTMAMAFGIILFAFTSLFAALT